MLLVENGDRPGRGWWWWWWEGTGGGGWRRRVAYFESLNLYGLLRYQAPWTRSDADTFVEG